MYTHIRTHTEATRAHLPPNFISAHCVVFSPTRPALSVPKQCPSPGPRCCWVFSSSSSLSLSLSPRSLSERVSQGRARRQCKPSSHLHVHTLHKVCFHLRARTLLVLRRAIPPSHLPQVEGDSHQLEMSLLREQSVARGRKREKVPNPGV